MRKLLLGLVVVAVVALFTAPAAEAGQLTKGEKEFLFSFSYTDRSDDAGNDYTTTLFDGRFGYLLTDSHEIGGLLSYSDVEVNNNSADATGIGLFYHFNFKAGTNMNPYLGAFYTFYGGDFGDITDSSYGLEGGLKVYPWDHAGFNFGARWAQDTGSDPNPDSDGFDLFAGVSLKW